MPKNTDTTDDESDGEQNDKKALTTRAKLAVLALWAWVKPRTKSAVDEARSQLAQASDEIAPQLRGAVDDLHVPRSALKPLGLAAVLLFAAVALGPAAPFASDSGPVDNGTEPVVGTTYEPVDEGEYRQVVTSRIGSLTSDAPPAPNEVRSSAGSQTMSVETSVRDGDPVIVLEDDRTHEGRWVALETSWFEEHVGGVPEAAYVEHESGSEYSTPIETRGGEAAFYVQGFSVNTVSFDGEFTIDASPATGGDSFSYNATNGGEDLSINVTGIENTASKSTSAVKEDGETISLVGGGTTPPQNGTITLTGKSDSESRSDAMSSVSDGSSLSLNTGGNQIPTDVTVSGTTKTGSESTSMSHYDHGREKLTTTMSGHTGTITGTSAEIYVDYGTGDSASLDSYLYVAGGDIGRDVFDSAYLRDSDSWYNDNDDSRVYTTTLSSSAEFTDSTVTVGIKTWNVSQTNQIKVRDVKNDYKTPYSLDISSSSGDTLSFSDGGTQSGSVALQPGSDTLSVSGSGEADLDVSWTANWATQDPSVSVGGQTVSHTGTLTGGETVTEPVDLSAGENDLSVSTGYQVGVDTDWTSVSETRDPVVEVNGKTTSVDGALEEGETVSLDVNDSWLQEGTNRVNVSTNSPTSGPASVVGLDYRHDVSKSRTINYTGEAFSERYNVSESWNEDTENASLTIPWASDRVIALRSVSVEHRDANGDVVQTLDSPTYAFEDGEVVVELGDVNSGWETTVSATGSKVQVDGADLEVLDPTDQGEDLNSKVRLNNPADDVYVRVGETEQGQQLHYLANSSWDTSEASRISADGTNELRIPGAPDNGEAQLRTLPIAFDVQSGAIDVDIPNDRVNEEEPVYRVGPGDQVGDEYDVTFTEAADAQPYVLYDNTDEIVLDQGLAESPLTLSATEPDSPHVLQFLEDDGTSSGTSTGGAVGSVTGGAAPMVTNSRPFSALSGLVPGPTAILVGLAGLVGLAVVSRETSLFDEGTRSDAVADATQDVAGRAGGLVERLLANEIVFGVVILGGAAWVLTSGCSGCRRSRPSSARRSLRRRA